MLDNVLAKRHCSFKVRLTVKSAVTLAAIALAVALPELFHLLGRVTDIGTALGETFLPIHIAVFAVSFIAGPVAGLVTGLAAPAISFALSGMPSVVMLPYMIVELAAYGGVSGLLANVKMPTILKLLIAQVAGRGLRAVAICIGAYAFGSPVNVSVIWTSIVAGLPGLILQWIILPLFMFWLSRKVNADE